MCHLQRRESVRCVFFAMARSVLKILILISLLQDMSYLCCVEIEGPEEEIIKPLKRLMSEETGESYKNITCIQSFMLYITSRLTNDLQ